MCIMNNLKHKYIKFQLSTTNRFEDASFQIQIHLKKRDPPNSAAS